MKISYNELGIYEVENLRLNILKELETQPSSFDFDFADITKIDLTFIQLLISVKKYCDDNNITFILSNITSKQVKKTFKMFNLNQTLGVEV